MSNILNFPSKKSFRDGFKGNIPDSVLDQMLEAYDRVIELQSKYPSCTFSVSPGYEQGANDLMEEFQNYVLILLKRILVLEAELCMAKNP